MVTENGAAKFSRNIDEKPLAIRISNAYYSYGKDSSGDNALEDVSLHVPQGCVYALFGPSGCGKTTLLKAITKLINLKKGQIILGNANRNIPGKDVGYMPQQPALIPELSIEENITLYGFLVGIKSNVLKSKIENLIKLLKLPGKGNLVRNLSGGQIRRVSFAVSLIHDASLLILDEPTVGVDPLLRNVIWDYLLNLSTNEGRTVFITTHYIDEARRANCVAFMRKGRLVAESTPTKIMTLYETNSLEHCFSQICNSESEDKITFPKIDECCENLKSEKFERQLSYQEVPKSVLGNVKDFNRGILALTMRNGYVMRRNLGLLVFNFILPMTQLFLYCTCVGRDVSGMSISIANEESPTNMSKLYFAKIDDQRYNLVYFDSLNNALESVRNGNSWAAVYIERNFTNCLLSRLRLGLEVDVDSIKCSSILVYMDTTNHIVSSVVKKELYDAYDRFSDELLTILGSNTEAAKIPLKFATPVHGRFDVTFTEYIIPSYIMCCSYFTTFMLTSVTLIMERNSGNFERLMVAGASRFQILLSHVFTLTFIVLGQVAISLTVPFLIYSFSIIGAVWLLGLLTLMQGFCGMMFGLLVSAVAKNAQGVMMFGVGFLYTNILLAGFFWPLEGSPTVIRYIAYFLPMTMPTEAIRAVISKGHDLTYTTVWFGLTSATVWTILFLIGAIIVFRYKK